MNLNEQEKLEFIKITGEIIRGLAGIIEEGASPRLFSVFKNQLDALENPLKLSQYRLDDLFKILKNARERNISNDSR